MSKTIAAYLPARVRAVIYTVLGALVALEQVWDFLPAALEGKWLATASVLGFGLAASQTPIKEG